jgi:hypothetical protein
MARYKIIVKPQGTRVGEEYQPYFVKVTQGVICLTDNLMQATLFKEEQESELGKVLDYIRKTTNEGIMVREADVELFGRVTKNVYS